MGGRGLVWGALWGRMGTGLVVRGGMVGTWWTRASTLVRKASSESLGAAEGGMAWSSFCVAAVVMLERR